MDNVEADATALERLEDYLSCMNRAVGCMVSTRDSKELHNELVTDSTEDMCVHY